MKILAFTDNHGSPLEIEEIRRKAKNADIIICAGDFTIFESDIEYHLEVLNSLPKKVLLIHGNHEDEDTVRFLVKKHKNIEFIHENSYETDVHIFLGWGGGGFATTDRRFEEAFEKFKPKMRGKQAIVMFHGPPYGTNLDLLGGGYVGNKSYTKFIKEMQPRLVICGHLHENFKKRDKIGNTLIINPGPEGEIIDI